MSALSEKVISISIGYLGPAAKVFLERQTRAHMGGLALDALDRQHLPELSKWVGISGGLIIDPGKAKELSEKIKNL